MSDFKTPGEYVYNGLVMCDVFPADILDRIPDFEFRPDDVLINTYPKAGTTWLQQIIWLIMNDVDIETSRKVPILERSPFIEIKWKDISGLELLSSAESPRVIKSHLPYQFFSKSIQSMGEHQLKVVIGMRNVKDLLVSYYHFYRMNEVLGNFTGDFDTFFDLFKEKRLVNGDYFDHVLSWWNERDNDNFRFVMYENLKKNPVKETLKLAEFLGKPLSESQVEVIVKESSFKEMQKNPATNMSGLPTLKTDISKFIRKGEVGDWRNYFTEQQIQYVNDRCEKELKVNGLEFRDV